MPRKEAPPEDTSVEAKLDTIILYLHRAERRDRTRMIGSYIHGMIWLAFTLFIFWSSWYFVTNMPEMIRQMTNQMIQGSMGINTSTDANAEENAGWMKMIEEYMKGQR